MKVYVLQFHDQEGSYFVSVWSTSALAQKAKDKKNATVGSQFRYDYDAVDIDTDPSE